MTDTITFQCNLSTTDPTVPLGLEILCNGTSMFKLDHVTKNCLVSFDIINNDEDATKKLQFVMSGKTTAHTKVDEQRNITSDAMLTISDFIIDEIDISSLLISKTRYFHDFNGTQPAVEEKFYGNMGCNGTVTFEFTAPFYLWLLEHM